VVHMELRVVQLVDKELRVVQLVVHMELRLVQLVDKELRVVQLELQAVQLQLLEGWGRPLADLEL